EGVREHAMTSTDSKSPVGRRLPAFLRFFMKKKRWIWVAIGAVVLGAALVAARGREKGDPKEKPSPFRIGKVQAEDLQVSVREVGFVDPVTKVDVKSAVSGRVLSLKVREGAVGRQGDLL